MTTIPTIPISSGRRRSVLLIVAFVCLAVVGTMCVAGLVEPGLNSTGQSLLSARHPASWQHLFGTDGLGRDVLARVIDGSSLTIVGPLAVAIGAELIAIPLALFVTSREGLMSSAIMRVSDTLMAIPALLLIIVVVGLLGGSYWLAVGVLTLLVAPSTLRIVRSAALGQQGLPYVESVRVLGASESRVMFVHVLPNLVPTIVATLLLDFVSALVSLSGLSFLGLGAPPGSSDWGTMLSENIALIDANPMAALAPALLLIATGASVTSVGDWLYDGLGRADGNAR